MAILIPCLAALAAIVLYDRIGPRNLFRPGWTLGPIHLGRDRRGLRRLERARRAVRGGDLGVATTLVQKVLAERPDHAEALTLLGQIERAVGDRSAAQDCLRAALASEPANLEAAQALAELYAESGDAERAAEQLARIVTLHPYRRIRRRRLEHMIDDCRRRRAA